MGVPRNEDYNGAVQEGASYFHQTARNGLRCSSARAFLNPAKKRPNLQIITHAHTEALVFDPDTSKPRNRRPLFGQERKRTRVRLNPGGEVILSAGAIGSPQILELSGIGRGDVLKAAGLDVRHELPGVGRVLCRTIFRSDWSMKSTSRR